MALGQSEETVPDRSPERHAMSGRLSDYGIDLEAELRVRGLHKAELARKAQVHPSTITHAVAGCPLTMASIRAIIQALDQVPPLRRPVADRGGAECA